MALISGVLIIAVVSVYVAATSECKTDGFFCRARCTELVRCTTSGNGTISEQVVRKCQGTLRNFCNVSQLDCSGDSCEDGELDTTPVTCHEDGIYPHPSRCDRFISCNNSVAIEFVCPVNVTYNANNRNCSGPSSLCGYTPIPRCQKIWDIGSYSNDPNIYYVCAYDQFGYLRPELHRCGVGYYFDNNEHKCVVPSSATLAAVNLFLFITITIYPFV